VGRFEANVAKHRLTQRSEGVQDIVFAGFMVRSVRGS